MITATAQQPFHQSLEQRTVALQRANEIRLQRADMKRDLKARRRIAAEIILFTPDYAETMKVRDLLVSVPKIGAVKGDRIMRIMCLSPSRTLGGLTERQRVKLAGLLAKRSFA